MLSGLSRFRTAEVARRMKNIEERIGVSRQIHRFSDASDKAYGACEYMPTVCDTGRVDIVLLPAKKLVR